MCGLEHLFSILETLNKMVTSSQSLHIHRLYNDSSVLSFACTLTSFSQLPHPLTDEREIGPNHKFYSHLSDEDVEEEEEEVCLWSHDYHMMDILYDLCRMTQPASNHLSSG